MVTKNVRLTTVKRDSFRYPIHQTSRMEVPSMNPRSSPSRWPAVAFLVVTLLFPALCPPSAAAAPTPVLRPGDMVAFVGGEDMVAVQANGYVELLLTLALPAESPRFRSLAFEGDTVFEQPRQLNFPPWEDVLQRVGATVVVVQFGQSESLKGRAGLAAFIEAYEKLLHRLAGTNSSRRIVMLSPTPFEAIPDLPFDSKERNVELNAYVSAIREMAAKHHHHFIDVFHPLKEARASVTRDGVHLNAFGHWAVARESWRQLGQSEPAAKKTTLLNPGNGELSPSSIEALRQAIVSKNRFWFDYWRPQNWAFLHGDRTEQASSRDHQNPKVRWFPAEMEKFLPLIAAKEAEIAALAAKAK